MGHCVVGGGCATDRSVRTSRPTAVARRDGRRTRPRVIDGLGSSRNDRRAALTRIKWTCRNIRDVETTASTEDGRTPDRVCHHGRTGRTGRSRPIVARQTFGRPLGWRSNWQTMFSTQKKMQDQRSPSYVKFLGQSGTSDEATRLMNVAVDIARQPPIPSTSFSSHTLLYIGTIKRWEVPHWCVSMPYSSNEG